MGLHQEQNLGQVQECTILVEMVHELRQHQQAVRDCKRRIKLFLHQNGYHSRRCPWQWGVILAMGLACVAITKWT